ncbi:MAG: transposase [Lachnospiraceae bacterium]|nr:transposase [Lachnospiraceae bacterium]MDD7665610.1 transposase [Lachnospiraceae bacterium]MDY2759100.1 transposase [Lachnospiraceae bacterium]MDY4164571.1 transposase [Lachnospiraceae bacterium]
MSCIIKSLDKRSGITYVYQSSSYCDKEKKAPRSKRVLISNEVKDPVEALQLYRTRDVVEKAFGNLKERLNCRRTLVSSESSLEGKLFVTFVSLIYLSYIKNRMQENDLFSKYTITGLLDELDVIECFTEPGKAPIQGEVLKKQEDLFREYEFFSVKTDLS